MPAVWWIWPILTAVVLAFQLWFPDSGTGIQHDTYSTTAEGQRAFYELVVSQAGWSERNTRPLAAYLQSGFAEPTLCILGPERLPTAKEWDAILDWVEDGGQLLFAFRGFKEASIPGLDVRYAPRFSQEKPDDSLPPDTSLTASPAIAWWTDGELIAPGRHVIVRYDDTVQAVRGNYGAGRFVISASSLIFCNQLLTYGDNPVLAMRLLESVSDLEGIAFDESLNETGTAKAVGLLFDREFRPLTLQCILLTVLYGWWNFQRFGPLLQPAVGRRQNIVDHTDALGVAYWRAHDGSAGVRAYCQSLQRRFHLLDPRRKLDSQWQQIAAELGETPESLLAWLQQVQTMSETSPLPRRKAAAIIRRLAQIAEKQRTSTLRPSNSHFTARLRPAT